MGANKISMNSLNKIQINSTGLLDSFLDTGYEEHPEWLRVITDNNDNILGGIKSTGEIEWSLGVPTPVKEYIDSCISEILNGNEGTDIDGLNKIISFLEKFSTSNTLADLLNVKVDKEEGKSLIPTQYIQEIENPEYIDVKTDSNDKIIEATRTDSTKYFSGDVEINGNIINDDINYLRNDIDNKVDKEELKSLIDEDYALSQLTIEDPETRLEITTDSEEKIISYRTLTGILVENVGIETSSLKINGEDITYYITKNENYVGSKTSVYCEKPEFGEFWFYGNLPTDTSDARTPKELDVSFKINNNIVFSSKCTLAIQGHGSVWYPKHGYTLDFLNDDREELKVKFGNMVAVDSFHLKGYWSDKTHSRCIGGVSFWRDMIRTLDYPYNKFNNKPLVVTAGQSENLVELYDAQYSEDGFPVAVYLNNSFYGLFTIKLKKSRENYAMDKSTKSQIFLDSIRNTAFLHEPFEEADWEVKNPKIKNYEEGGPITDAFVLNSCQRLFRFLNDIENQKENASDFIVVPHWIHWLIFQELVGGWDTNGNNYELLTWNAAKTTIEGEDVYSGQWSIFPYDLDLTVGLEFTGGGVEPGAHMSFYTEQDGFIASKSSDDITHPDITVKIFFSRFRNLFADEIREEYTRLRKNGTLTLSNVYNHYLKQCRSIPRSIQTTDRKLWGYSWADDKETSLEQIYSYLHSRIDFLDSQWLINENE